MDAELRDAERAAASGDPLEVERLAGLRARSFVAPPQKRRGQADDRFAEGPGRTEVERLHAIMEQRKAAHDRAERHHGAVCRGLAEEVESYLARPSRERARAFSREFLARLSAREVTERAAMEADWVAYGQACHGWTRAALGRCPVNGPRFMGRNCDAPLGADGRCTKCSDDCGCDGCSGAL